MHSTIIHSKGNFSQNLELIESLKNINSRVNNTNIPLIQPIGIRGFEYSWVYEMIKRYSKKSYILDFGSGTSPFPVFLEEKGYNVYAIDNASYEWYNKSENWDLLLKEQFKTNVKYLFGNILNVFKNTEKFDIIYSVSVFEHIKRNKEIKKIFEKFKAILKKDGILVLTIDYYPEKKNPIYFFLKYSKWVLSEFPINKAVNKIRNNRYSNVNFKIFNLVNFNYDYNKIRERCSIGIYGQKGKDF